MPNKTPITIEGNLTKEPELRFTPSGAAVANFTVAVTDRNYNKDTNAWEDGVTTFYRCAVWRDQAENVAESLVKGSRVIVTGTFHAREWEKDGKSGLSLDIDVDAVGPSLRYATAKVTKAQRSTGGQGGGDQWSAPGPQGGWGGQQQGQQQGWGGQQPQGQQPQQGWGGPGNDEPPF